MTPAENVLRTLRCDLMAPTMQDRETRNNCSRITRFANISAALFRNWRRRGVQMHRSLPGRKSLVSPAAESERCTALSNSTGIMMVKISRYPTSSCRFMGNGIGDRGRVRVIGYCFDKLASKGWLRKRNPPISPHGVCSSGRNAGIQKSVALRRRPDHLCSRKTQLTGLAGLHQLLAVRHRPLDRGKDDIARLIGKTECQHFRSGTARSGAAES